MELVLVLIFSGKCFLSLYKLQTLINTNTKDFTLTISSQVQVKKKILIFENFFVDFLFQIVHKFLTLLIYDFS